MSQAFVKEGDASDDLPERPISDKPNYVTPSGLADLKRKRDGLAALHDRLAAAKPRDADALKRVERDLRYYEARLGGHILIQRKPPYPAEVLFGATVEVRDEAGIHRYAIVGEDEADPARGLLSWSSPFALALLGSKPGGEVSWESDGRARRCSILSVSYG